jgi:hypothetical protein
MAEEIELALKTVETSETESSESFSWIGSYGTNAKMKLVMILLFLCIVAGSAILGVVLSTAEEKLTHHHNDHQNIIDDNDDIHKPMFDDKSPLDDIIVPDNNQAYINVATATPTATPTASPTTIPTSSPTSACSKGDFLVLCDGFECKEEEIHFCLIDCVSGSCDDSVVSHSLLRCVSDSCNGLHAKQSAIDCVDSSCGNTADDKNRKTRTQFLASSVRCDADSCRSTDFLTCSCCDGEGCPVADVAGNALPSCHQTDFCSFDYLGKTCAEWGNPVCKDESTTLQQIEDDDNTFCLNMDCNNGNYTLQDTYGICYGSSCNNKTLIKDANIDCVADSCNFARTEDSKIHCSSGSCISAQFDTSMVECDGFGSCSRGMSDWINGDDPYTEFVFSAVHCGEGSCAVAAFSFCSCCDGPGCPHLNWLGEPLPSCETDIVPFCESTYQNITCSEWGNPTCNSS